MGKPEDIGVEGDTDPRPAEGLGRARERRARAGVPAHRLVPNWRRSWVGEGGAPASPAATASLEPLRVCRARAVAHYCNYAALSLPRP